MSQSVDRARRELESMGYDISEFDSPQGRTVSFNYEMETGSHKGEHVRVGVSFQEEGYPEYPPHWVHISPPINDGKGGIAKTYTCSDGRKWLAMSRPPGDIWDRLPTKHMTTYISEHLRRLWSDV